MKLMKSVLYTLPLALILGMTIAGCTVTSETTSSTSYEGEEFGPQELQQNGLAIMPIQSAQAVEGYRRPFGDEINKTAVTTLSDAEVVKWEESQTRINDAGLVETYREAIESYAETSILDEGAVQKLGGAVEKRYLLVINLAPPQTEKDIGYDPITGGTMTSETRSVSAFGKIWDAGEGDIVWEGVATTEVTTNDYTKAEGTTQSRAKATAQALMRRIMGMSPQEE